MNSTLLTGFKEYLQIERSLSKNSVEAYMRDVGKLTDYLKLMYPKLIIGDLTQVHFQEFLTLLGEIGISPSSQARILSATKTFFKYLLLENLVTTNPTELLESPKLERKDPPILSVEEIDKMIACIDQSKPEGVRNKAIIETLYGCGLRVSELTNLKLSNLFLDIGFVKILGKGQKERLVPINATASKQISLYQTEIRSKGKINKGNEDFVFLNRRGNPLTRVMIFVIVKELAKAAEINKNVSPHTFRHSFATHLYQGGADLRAIQEMLGHKSITTTEIYSRIDDSYLRDTLTQYHPRFVN